MIVVNGKCNIQAFALIVVIIAKTLKLMSVFGHNVHVFVVLRFSEYNIA